MNASKLITTSVAALAVVGAGLVYAQTSPATPAAPDQGSTQAAPMTPPPAGSMTTPSATMTPPSQETLQRSDTPMAPDAQADRN
ncbi:MAG: hypothetical protein C4535_17100 [Comamonadaceae bacterium]|nr:MAG: hypothetical protein C4535_17100 [Comamonadaceae bacterium]